MDLNYVNTSFDNLVNFVKVRDLEDITNAIKHNFNHYRNKNYLSFKSIVDYYNKYKLWGEIDLDNSNFELINRNADALVNHIEDFQWLYNQLGDYRSKMILSGVLYYWLMLDESKIRKLKDDFYSQYFDLDLVKCNQDEVFVDIGAYTGDTLIDYVNIFGKDCYKKIYCYEIIPSNIEYIKKNIENFGLKNVVIKEKGASNKNGISFIENDEVSSIEKLSNSGKFEIETVKVDDDIKGEVSFIKMDIEGGELEALLGLKKIVAKYKPKLAISVYHNNNHLWQIPKIIHEINPDYKFYLRYYGGPILPTEYILYAV